MINSNTAIKQLITIVFTITGTTVSSDTRSETMPGFSTVGTATTTRRGNHRLSTTRLTHTPGSTRRETTYQNHSTRKHGKLWRGYDRKNLWWQIVVARRMAFDWQLLTRVSEVRERRKLSCTSSRITVQGERLKLMMIQFRCDYIDWHCV